MACFNKEINTFNSYSWTYKVLDCETVNNCMKREFNEKKEYSKEFLKDLELKNLIRLVA